MFSGQRRVLRGRFVPPVIAIVAVLVLATGWRLAAQIPWGHDSLAHMQNAIRLAEDPRGTVLGYFFSAAGPMKYMPVTWLLTAPFLLTTDFAPGAYTVPVMLLALLALAFLSASVERRSEGTAEWLLPLAVVLAAPAFWEVLFSYNLEAATVAGATCFLFLFLRADALTTRAGILAAAGLLFLLTWSKAVLLFATVPAGVLFCLAADPPLRRRRLVLLTAVLVAAGVWLVPRLPDLINELATDRLSVGGEEPPGPFYHVRTVLFAYYGLPLIGCLVFFVAHQWRRRTLTREDLALGFFFLLPFLALSFFHNKRLWYLLPFYLVLPIWFARHIQDMRRFTAWRVIYKTLLVFYTVLAVLNAAGVALQIASPQRFVTNTLRLPAPSPPTPGELELVNAINAHFDSTPCTRVAVDLSQSTVSAQRLRAMMYLRAPHLALVDNLAVAANIGSDWAFFALHLPHAQALFSLAIDFPVIDCAQVFRNAAKFDCETLNASLVTLKPRFGDPVRYPMPDGASLTRRDQLAEQAGASCARPIMFDHCDAVAALAEKDLGQRNLQDGVFRVAAAHLAVAHRCLPEDWEATAALARALTLAGEHRAASSVWHALMTQATDFEKKIDGLRFAKEQELRGMSLPVSFAGLHAIAETSAQSRAQQVALSSELLDYHIKRSDWHSALLAIDALESLATPEQRAGIVLQRAQALHKMGRAEEAARIADRLLRQNGDVSADAAFLLAQILAEQRRFDEARNALQHASQLPFDERAFVGATIGVARVLVAAGGPDRAAELLEWGRTTVQKPNAPGLLIELGNLALTRRDVQRARALFSEALSFSSDETQKQWLHETLEELARNP